VVRLVAERQTLAAETAAAEAEMNALVFALYGLTDDERRRILTG
jgi:hypothetical protein